MSAYSTVVAAIIGAVVLWFAVTVFEAVAWRLWRESAWMEQLVAVTVDQSLDLTEHERALILEYVGGKRLS